MRVVLDTNTIIPDLNFPGNERLVLELAHRRRFELYLSTLILQETAGVLTHKFDWSPGHPLRTFSTTTSKPGARESLPSAVSKGKPWTRATDR